MEELERKKKILYAIKEAISNIRLENDFEDIELDDELFNEIEEKVMKLGGINEAMGRLCS